MRSAAIVVLNWNRKDLLERCLTSLGKTKYSDFRTIVVDNGSTDGSVEMVKFRFPEVDLVELKENKGFPAGNNAGIRYALLKYDSDYVVLLNNDTLIVQEDWLSHMIQVAESDGRIGVVNCRFVSADGATQKMGLRLMPGLYVHHVLGMPLHVRESWEQDASVHEVDVAGGACILIRKSVFEKVGQLDEGYFPILFEDIDFCIRARKANFKVIHDGQVAIVHLGSSSVRAFEDSKAVFVFKKNLFRFTRRHYPYMLPLVLLISYLGVSLKSCQTGSRYRDLRTLLNRLIEHFYLTTVAFVKSGRF